MGLQLRYGSIGDDEFKLFRDYIVKNCGIAIPPEKAYLIETRLSMLMAEAGADSFGDFYKIIVSDGNPELKQKIINAITTNETSWFRDETPWKVMEESLLPKLVEDLTYGRKERVRIWFSAVSTGQEAYSTIMFIDDYLKRKKIKVVGLRDFDFVATDISTRALDIAKRGRYDRISINRGLGPYHRLKYFNEDGMSWELDPSIRESVRFERFSLLDSFAKLGTFDIIFCRYVLIYFADSLKREIIEKMRGALTDEGVIFTGHYALYEFFLDGFNMNHYDNLTYYSKRTEKQ